MEPLNGGRALVIGFALCAFSTATVALRLYCRYFLTGKIAAFDYVMNAAVVIAWGNFALNFYIFHFSGEVPKAGPEKMSPSQFKHTFESSLMTWYLYRIFYILNLGIVKLSIILFYYHLAVYHWFRRSVHATLALVGLSTLIMLAVTIISCAHPSDAWSIEVLLAQISGKPVRTCLPTTSIWLAQAGLNLTTDVIIFFLPMPTLLSTNLPPMKKIGLVAIFSVGIMAIVASSIRLWIISLWAETAVSETVLAADMIVWGQVEINSGIVSASIPFLRPLLRSPTKSESPKPGVKVAANPRKITSFQSPKLEEV